MKKRMFGSLLCLLASVYVSASEKQNWTVSKNVGLFSYTAEFNLKAGNAPLGKVVRTGLCTPTYYYDLYNAKNEFQIRGITRVFSLGMLAPRGMEIDLYEDRNVVGKIEGQFLTRSRAKFMFYDSRGRSVAEAHLDDESSNFLIVSVQDGMPLAELTGKAYGDASIWEMKFINTSNDIDERVLQLFAGFVSDYQHSFIRPAEKEVYYIDRHKDY